jgi:NAD(P)-dependent dehydrogenase (short-subunit alcohol dehydrogenase family)
VNLGSGCNKLAFPSLVAYTASKGGIEMFTKEAAVELGRYNIRINNWQAAFGLRSCLPTRLRVAQFGQKRSPQKFSTTTGRNLSRSRSAVQFDAGFCPRRQGERSFHCPIASLAHAAVLSV